MVLEFLRAFCSLSDYRRSNAKSRNRIKELILAKKSMPEKNNGSVITHPASFLGTPPTEGTSEMHRYRFGQIMK